MTLRKTVLTSLRGLAALTAERTRGAATAATTWTRRTGIAATVLEAAAEMITGAS